MLYFDGHDLTKMELPGRRHLLEDLIGESDGTIRVSQEVEADGRHFWRPRANMAWKASSPSTVTAPTAQVGSATG